MKLLLINMGPIFIKFGQILSTRQDLLTDKLVQELVTLQDNVPPFDHTIAMGIITQEMHNISEFKTIESAPIASASIAQIYGAKLHSGEDVIIKIVRPGIKKQIKQDIKFLQAGNFILSFFSSTFKKFNTKGVLDEFGRTLSLETDMQQEAANAALMTRTLQHNPNVKIPKIFWQYTSNNILVSERIFATPLTRLDLLRKKNVDTKLVAQRGIQLVCEQIFLQNYFHADMHPGNIFVDTSSPLDPKIVLVDFGIVSSLSNSDQRYLAQNFIALFNRDYEKIVELHIQSGWVSEKIDALGFASALRAVSEPVLDQALHKISFANTMIRLFHVVQNFEMKLQPQLFLLQKTLFNLEGLARNLDPELNLWSEIKPFFQHWRANKYQFKHKLKEFKDTLPYIMEKMPYIPEMLIKNLDNKNYKASLDRPYNNIFIAASILGLAYVITNSFDRTFIYILGVLAFKIWLR